MPKEARHKRLSLERLSSLQDVPNAIEGLGSVAMFVGRIIVVIVMIYLDSTMQDA